MASSAAASSPKRAVFIMAAGKGTRLNSERPKVLHQIGGRPLLAHVIHAASRVVPVQDIYAIVGHQAEIVRAAMEPSGIRFIDQPQQLGTGHAIQCARQAIAAYDSILVLSGDVPLIRPETIQRLWQFHQAQQAAMTILTGRARRATCADATVTAGSRGRGGQDGHGRLLGLMKLPEALDGLRTDERARRR